MPPVSEEGDEASLFSPSGSPTGAALREGPQPIMPPGFGATSPISGESSPRGAAPDTQGVTAIGMVPGRANSGIQMGELGGVVASAAEIGSTPSMERVCRYV